jgi:ribose transport system substrate-binding protein
VSFVASDNYHGGELAAEEMGRLLGGKGKLLALRYQEGVFSTEQREKGFIDKLNAAYPGIELVSSNQYAGASRDTAKTATENLLNRFGDDLDGIFTPNESSTAGALLALEDAGKAGKVRFIGFDASDASVQAMRDGKLHGMVVQNPFRMGELGLKTMVDHLLGKPVAKRVDTGVTLITPANLQSAVAQQLLHPPLERYLK